MVKVQRPQVATLVRKDLRAMSWLAPHLVGRIPIAALANPPALVELFAETIVEELDFRLEAANMLDIAEVLAELGQRGYVVPRPHPRLVTRRVLVMERLSGFKFDDVAGMRDAGIDTEEVIRTGMIAFMEGAMIHGLFHGDLHGGNLFVLPDGRTALLDFGIVGRLDDRRRTAFLRLMLGATTNDVKGQLAALRDLGALPPDTDLHAVIKDLRLDQPPVDPDDAHRRRAGEGGPAGGQGPARLRRPACRRSSCSTSRTWSSWTAPSPASRPTWTSSPRSPTSRCTSPQAHGERLGRELGIDHTQVAIDLDGVKASFGVDASTAAAHLPRPPAPPGADQQAHARAASARCRLTPHPLTRHRPCASSSPAAGSTTRGACPPTCPRPCGC